MHHGGGRSALLWKDHTLTTLHHKMGSGRVYHHLRHQLFLDCLLPGGDLCVVSGTPMDGSLDVRL
jgi:hypothetical protein